MATAANNIRGAGWIVGAAAVATVMSSGVHELAGVIHSAQIVFVRGAVGSVMILAFMLPRSNYEWKTRHWKLHLMRGVLGVIAINLGFYSITILPLATVTALFFTTPLFVTAFSVPILKEKLGFRRLGASLIGFFGAITVIGYLPEPFEIRWAAPIFASMAFALVLLLGKKLSVSEKPGTIVLYFSVMLAIGGLPPAVVVWDAPSVREWILLIIIAGSSALRNYMDVRGYAIGDAQFVAPFLYTRMIFMVTAGYFIFQEVPTLSALGGAAIIISATLYILRREMKIQKKIEIVG